MRLALTEEETNWHRYVHGMLDQIGVESHLIGPNEIKELAPILELDDVIAGFHTPNDGWTDPSGCTRAMAKGHVNSDARSSVRTAPPT